MNRFLALIIAAGVTMTSVAALAAPVANVAPPAVAQERADNAGTAPLYQNVYYHHRRRHHRHHHHHFHHYP
ncbi:MAG TPA: hypothetical protein VIJ42_13330 [Stellaceae bacterium]